MTTADLQHEYETFYVTKPELPDDEVNRISEKLLGAIERFKGALLVSEDWGRRKLSYPIQRQNHGRYIYMNYVGPAALPVELERSMGLEDNLIRFLTVKLGEDVDVEERRVMAQERTRVRAERLAAPKKRSARRWRPSTPPSATTAAANATNVARATKMNSIPMPSISTSSTTKRRSSHAPRNKAPQPRPSLPLLRRQDDRHRLQGPEAPPLVHHRGRKNRSAPHHRQLRAPPAAARHGDQAGPASRVRAVRGRGVIR
jgi:small subunit ribosomal protein S6